MVVLCSMACIKTAALPIGHKIGEFTILSDAGKGRRGIRMNLGCDRGHVFCRDVYDLHGSSPKRRCRECARLDKIEQIKMPRMLKYAKMGLKYSRKDNKSEYQCWLNIRKRCTNPNMPNWKDYGGRGILICDRWLNSFDNFLDDVGQKPHPSVSLDRIDNDGNYEPGNVRWATYRQQSANQRSAQRGIVIPFEVRYDPPSEMLWPF